MAQVKGSAGADRLGGTSGNDSLSGGAGVDYLYGGAGNDAFVLRLSDFDASLNDNSSSVGKAQDFIWDFHGAGVYEAGNNDFLYLADFGAGSTITFAGYGQNSATGGEDVNAQFYTIFSTNTGLEYTIAVGSVNGNQLVLGDYNFYN